jgi:hypothetical protein
MKANNVIDLGLSYDEFAHLKHEHTETDCESLKSEADAYDFESKRHFKEWH